MSIYNSQTLIAFYIPTWKRALLWCLRWHWQLSYDRTVLFGYKKFRGVIYWIRAERVERYWR